MSKTITSYFNVIPKNKKGDNSSASNNKSKFSPSDVDKAKSVSPAKRPKSAKRKPQILSDSEDEETTVKQKSKKGHSANENKAERDKDASTSKSSKKPSEPIKRSNKRQVLSDSEDEIVENKQKSKKTHSAIKEKISPKKSVPVADVFSNKPIKRIEAVKPTKKLREEDGEFIIDDVFEAALNKVEQSEIEKAAGKTHEDDQRVNHSSKIALYKIGRKTGDSKTDEAEDKPKVFNGISHAKKISEEENVSSKHFHGSKTTGKDASSKSAKSNESSKASGSGKKTSNDTSSQKGISKITIDKTPAKKRKRSEEDDEADPFEAIAEKKKRSAALYQQYLHRGGARNPGSKEIPTGADNCLAGLSFVITGVLESMEREDADELIKKYGGRAVAQVSKKTNYVILGEEPGPAKLEKAKHFGVKMISEDGLLDLIRTRPGSQVKNDTKNINGKKKTPRKAKQKTPEPEPLTSSKTSPSPKAEQKSKANSVDSDTKPKTLATEKPNTSKATEICQKSDIPPVVRVPSETGSQVWVEKYKPKNMKQIIGQQGDKSNASKLHHWLKNWQKNQSGDVKHPRPSPWQQTDGAFFKAALLSGPPGVGKTTTVQVVCNALGLDALEFNASDTRSKRLLKQEVSELLSNKSMKGYFVGGDSKKPDLNHVLVMDEVDGMAGNEDRGGLQELIVLIKTTNVPIICICNERNNPKMRTLSNYTFDLKFQKPRIEQIRSAMMSVCFKEGIKIPTENLNRLIESTNNDVRQVLNHLSLLADNPSIDENARGRRINKDLHLGPWDVVQKVFTHEAHKTMSIHDKSDLFFHDYNISPLFVQENYLGVVPNCPKNEILGAVADSAESLALGDLIENAIRRSGAWSLLPTQACYSSVIPGTLMSGHISKQIMFPAWLGQNSRRGKFDRLLQEITIHTRLATSASKDSINLDYLKHLRDAVVRPLITEGADGAASALEAMNSYYLLREDLDSLAEVSMWPGQRDPMQSLDSKVKAAFTRAFNKHSTMRPYAVLKGTEKKKRAQAATQEDLLDVEGEESASEEEEDSPSSDPMIKVKTASAAGSKKASSSSGKGSGAGAKKKANPRGGKSK